MKTLLAAAAALLLVAGSAAAQQGGQHHHGQQTTSDSTAAMHGMARGGMGGMMGGMMGRMMGGTMAMDRPSPARLLGAADALGLDEDQVARLEAVDSAFHADHHEPMHAAMAAEARAGELLEGDAPDLETYREVLEEAARHRVAARVVEVRASLEAMAVLTPEQRETLHRSLHMAHTLMGGHGTGG